MIEGMESACNWHEVEKGRVRLDETRIDMKEVRDWRKDERVEKRFPLELRNLELEKHRVAMHEKRLEFEKEVRKRAKSQKKAV